MARRVQFTFTFTNAQPGASVDFGPQTVKIFGSATDPEEDGRRVLDSNNSVTVWADADHVIAMTTDGQGEPLNATARRAAPSVTTDEGTAGTNPFGSGSGTSSTSWRGPFLIDAATATTLQVGRDQHWHLAITGVPTGGTFTLVAFDNASDASDAIPFDVDAAGLQAAIESIGNVGAGGVAVTGTNPAFDIVLDGDLVGFLGTKARVPMTVGTNGLTGGTSPGVTLTETQVGRTTVYGRTLFTPTVGDIICGFMTEGLTPWDVDPTASLVTLGGSFSGSMSALISWNPNEGTDLRPMKAASPGGYRVLTTEQLCVHLGTGGAGSPVTSATTGTGNIYVQTATTSV